MSKDDQLARGLAWAKAEVERRERDPFSYSELVEWIELDTWDTDSALLLMAGIAPTGAQIQSSYENLLGVRIDRPKIINAQLLDKNDLFYLAPWETPDTEEEALNPEEQEDLRSKLEALKGAQQRYRRIHRIWHSDPDNTLRARDTPEAFLNWAERKRVSVPWREWFLAHRPVALASPEVEQDLSSRKTPPAESGTLQVNPRAETTYLTIIGCLVALIVSKSPGGQRYSSFESQSALIDVLLTTFPNHVGIKQRTLEEKFAAAKRAIDSQ